MHIDPSSARRARTAERRNAVIAAVLAFAAGATDAFAFLQLSGVFTANMTGNLVLVGLVGRPGYLQSVVGIVVAVIVFAGTLLVAFRSVPSGARPVRRACLLTVGLGAQTVVLSGWIATGGMPRLVIPVLIAFSAVAMASQTAIAKRIEGASGVTTTYVTGTLTSLMADLADRKQQPVVTRLGVIVALVCGALLDALLAVSNPAFGAMLPVVPTAVAVAILWSEVRRTGSRRQPPASPRGS